MDHTARPMFEALPEDLEIRGWKLVRQESTMHRLLDAEWYAVVFMRPFDLGIDDERFSPMVRANRRNYVRISTNTSKSASWEEAFHDAIGLMRAVDDRRVVPSVA